MDGDDLVFENARVVIEVALENRALGNLDQPRGDFHGAQRLDLLVFPAPGDGDRRGTGLAPRDEHRDGEKCAAVKPAHMLSFHLDLEISTPVQCGSQPGPRSSRTARLAPGNCLRSSPCSSPSMGVSATLMMAIVVFA